MALVILYDPYEWVNPEKGRQGIIAHTSIFDRLASRPRSDGSWPEVWEALDRANQRPS